MYLYGITCSAHMIKSEFCFLSKSFCYASKQRFKHLPEFEYIPVSIDFYIYYIVTLMSCTTLEGIFSSLVNLHAVKTRGSLAKKKDNVFA